MTINQIGNDDDGVSASPTPRVDTGGTASELIRLSLHLSNASHSARKAALQLQEAVIGSTRACDASGRLRAARSGPADIPLVDGSTLHMPNATLSDKMPASDDEYISVWSPEHGIRRTKRDPEAMPHRCETCGTKDGHMLNCIENIAADDADIPAPTWGDPIAVDGKRPEWLRDDEQLSGRLYSKGYGGLSGVEHDGPASAECISWDHLISFRLPASHPAYLAIERGFVPWGGGDSAPADWDSTRAILTDCADEPERHGDQWDWRAEQPSFKVKIIGYHRKPEADEPDMSPDAVGEALADMGFGSEVTAPDPRAPLMAEVEDAQSDIIAAQLGMDDLPVALLDRLGPLLERLAAELIAQDARFLQARTYDEEARNRARDAVYRRFYDPNRDPVQGVTTTTATMVDVVATALGLQRACNAAAT